MKKKEEYCSIFMTTLMFVIPSGAVIALLIEIFSISGIYKVLTDLGSFLAGIVGVIGVLILIWHQNKTTREMIHSNIHVMKHEALETQKAKAFEHAANIGYRFQSLTIGSNRNFNTWSSSPGRNLFEHSKKSIYFLEAFFRTHDNHSKTFEGILCIQSISEFCGIYENKKWLNTQAPYSLSDFSLLLGTLMNLNLIPNSNTLIKSNTVIYQYLNQHNQFTQIYGPEDLHHNFNSFSNNDICGFLTQYMRSVIMPTLIHNITLIDINHPTE